MRMRIFIFLRTKAGTRADDPFSTLKRPFYQFFNPPFLNILMVSVKMLLLCPLAVLRLSKYGFLRLLGQTLGL